jgi:hypothetical protein
LRLIADLPMKSGRLKIIILRNITNNITNNNSALDFHIFIVYNFGDITDLKSLWKPLTTNPVVQ